jgi:hypothetical protein
MSAIRRMLLGLSISLSAVICPNPLVAYEPALDARAAELQCVIEPGVYVIMDPVTEDVVGVLIVYPDCKLEVLPI